MSTLGAPLALRSLEYWLFQYKRTWRGSVVSTVLFPVLFLASMGLGLGALVDSSASRGVDGLPYLVFLAPGLLAATAMQTGVGESTYPVMGAIKWFKTYLAMLATPLGV
ncbi:MAG TPA: inner membrane protein YbjM, partial [Mycobacteriales bacterium]|nr:inner membrane protein YbjM [Mycobacteriales bacterium]